MPTEDIPEAIVDKPKGIPIVWLLPFIALVIGSWLFYQSLVEAPEEIRIQFPSAEGIVPDKTAVKFKGIPIGVVKSMAVKKDLQAVVVKIDIDRGATKGLVDGTQFWMVTPKASLAGVSGLDTLLSGAYINVAPGDLESGVAKRDFIALDEPQPLDHRVPGLHLTLTATKLGSLFVDAPVIYKDFSIGSVQAYRLHDDGMGVSVNIYIEPEFSSLVGRGSRFYNSSGVSFSGDLSGFELKLDSLASLLVGGITLQNDVEEESANLEGEAVRNGDIFQLYENYRAARAGETIKLRLPAAAEIVANKTKIKYKGFVIGRIESVQLSSNMQSRVATALMVPGAIPYLTSGSRFWLVKPQLSLTEITGLDTILTGSYLAMGIGEGDSQREFDLLSEAPPSSYNVPGLHIKLLTESLASVGRGTEILFQKIPVGKVQGFKLLKDRKIQLEVFIEPKYAHLVNSKTRFWNVSGIEISGGLSGLKLRTESLTSIIRGGITFSSTSGKSPGKPAVNGNSFTIYKNAEEAEDRGVEIRLAFQSGEGLSIGMPIKYMGIQVGEVKSVALNNALNGIDLKAVLNPGMNRFAVLGSLYWLVKPRLGLTSTANLGTLVSGQYIEVKPGAGKPVFNFVGLDSEPMREIKQHGLNIVLTTQHLGSLKAGVKLHYRGVPVGEVTGYDLSNNARHVRVYANVKAPYNVLVRENTVFWNESGIDLSFRLFGGAKLKTNSLESVLGGGVAFSTPDDTALAAAAAVDSVFKLEATVKDEWLQWKTKIAL